jgi:hypothetical protein
MVISPLVEVVLVVAVLAVSEAVALVAEVLEVVGKTKDYANSNKKNFAQV